MEECSAALGTRRNGEESMIRFRAGLACVGAAAVLTTGVTGTAQAAAPGRASAARPAVSPAAASRIPSTRVAGVDVDAATVPQLERLMNRHRLTSVHLVRFYLQRIRALNPKL